MQPVTEERAAMRAACAAAGGPGTKEGWAALWQQGLTTWDLKGPTPVLYSEVTAAVVAGRLQLGGRGKQLGVQLKLKSEERWWMGLVAMALPLGTGLLQAMGVLK